MINTIQAIRGPEFIFLYTLYAIAVIILFNVFIWLKDDSRGFHIPHGSEATPLEVTVLRNGSNLKAILHTILFDLWQKKLITIREDGFVFASPSVGGDQKITRLEKDILQPLRAPKQPDSIVGDRVIMEKLKSLLAPVKENLIQKKLIPDGERVKETRIIFLIFLFVILLPSVIKFFLGISRNKPVFFLIILMVAAVIFLTITYKQKTVRSSLGKKYLKNLIERYKKTVKSGKTTAVFPDNADPVLMAAIFGAGALLAFPQFGLYAQTFNPGSAGSFGDSISSGGGCGGCGGGGGCGGCGGGD